MNVVKKKYILYAFTSCLIFISCNKSTNLFVSLQSSQTNIDFANNLQEKNFFGVLNYIYYYNGGGVAIGDINNDGLPDIYFTANSHEFKNNISRSKAFSTTVVNCS